MPRNSSPLPMSYTLDSNTKLLANFNGVNGATSYVSESGHIFTFRNGSTLTNTQKKYGDTSYHCNGSSQCAVTPNDSACELGDRDFTVEAWVRSNGGTWGNVLCWSGVQFMFTAGNLGAQCWAGGEEWWANSSGITVLSGAWYHVAWVRKGNSGRVYINGVGYSDIIEEPRFFPAPESPRGIAVGAEVSDPAPYSQFTSEYVQGLRVSNIARYTADFTPPLNLFPR